MNDRWERIRGGLYGLLVGDARGVPYEFSPPAAIPARDLIEMSPPAGFARAHPAVPVGTWSDDGAQALVLLNSLVEDSSLTLKQFTEGLLLAIGDRRLLNLKRQLQVYDPASRSLVFAA